MLNSLRPFFELPDSYCVLDTETTGFADAKGPPGIVTVGLARVENRNITDAIEFAVKPYRPIKRQAEKIHGISNQQANTFSAFSEQWPLIKPWIDHQLIIIHNARFDWPIIEFHIQRYHLEPPVNFRIFCSQQSTVKFAKEKGIPVSSRGPSLDNLTAFLGIEPLRIGGIHGAEIDCRQTALVVEALRTLSIS